MNVVYLKKGDRRPKGNTMLIECMPKMRGGEILEASDTGAITVKIRADDLDEKLADLEKKGLETVYVRKR